MFAGARAAGAMTAIAEAAGTDETVEVMVNPDQVIAEMATSPGAATFDRYVYRNGSVTQQGAATIQPEDPDQTRFRLSDVEWEQVPQLLNRAMEQSGLEPDDLDSPPLVRAERPSWSDGKPALRLSVSLNTPYESHYLEAGADGLLLPDPDEESSEPVEDEESPVDESRWTISPPVFQRPLSS